MIIDHKRQKHPIWWKFAVRLLALGSLLFLVGAERSVTTAFTLAKAAPCNVAGFINSNTTWRPDTCEPYIITGNIIVQSGVTLSIEPGTLVKFDSLKAMTIQGTLIAQGTEANPITFTSNADSPSRGDWGYIHFSDSSVDATYDGGGSYLSGLLD